MLCGRYARPTDLEIESSGRRIPQNYKRCCAARSIWRAVYCGGPRCTTTRPDAEGATVLLLVVHHMIVDATSEAILLRDLAAAFADPGGDAAAA